MCPCQPIHSFIPYFFNVYYLFTAHALFMGNSLWLETKQFQLMLLQLIGMKLSSYTRTCINQSETHGQFSPLKIALCAATKPKKQGFGPCKAQNMWKWALSFNSDILFCSEQIYKTTDSQSSPEGMQTASTCAFSISRWYSGISFMYIVKLLTLWE